MTGTSTDSVDHLHPGSPEWIPIAQKTFVQLTDDVDGSEAAETVRFSIDGVSYEIDLSDVNAAALRDSLALYVQRGRRAARSTPARPSAARLDAAGGYDPKAVRIWAASNGIDVPARGRIPASVLSQFRAAGN